VINPKGLEQDFSGKPVSTFSPPALAAGVGEAVGLLGPNGAGKTTIFYMITGLVQGRLGQP
jgi:ABC-type lipopolysaccharide export system ATPase subunit